MPAQAMKRLVRLSLAGFALLAITLFAEARLGTSDADAQIEPQASGDGTVIFGGTSQGASNDLTVGVGDPDPGLYVMSVAVPVGGNFYGLGFRIDYDPTQVTPACDEETETTSGVFNLTAICFIDEDEDQISVVLEARGPGVSGITGTHTFLTIEFTGVADTSNALGTAAISVACINDDEEDIDCDLDLGAVIVGEGGGNVCTTPSVNLISGLNGTILWTGAAVPLAQMGTVLPSNITQVFEFTFAKQGHTSWFRLAPGASDMLNGLQPGHFYLMRSNAAATLNVPSPETFVLPGSGNLNSQIGLNPGLWINATVAKADIAAALPTQITQLFQFSTSKGGYQSWFRLAPGASDLNGGMNQCGGFLARSNTNNTLVPGMLTPP